MNFLDLKIRATQLAKKSGYDDVQPQPDWTKLVNRALYLFSWAAEYQYGSYTFVTVIGQAEYNLPTPSDWIRVTDVAYNTTSNLTLTDETLLRRQNPLWHIAPNNTPENYFISNPNTLRLYPVPAVAGITVNVRGIKTDTALVLDTDVPDCPDPFHEGICLLAAWLHAKSFAKAEDAAMIQAYHTEAMDYAGKCQLYLAQQSTPVLQRYVRRSLPERMSLGWSR